MIWGCITYDGLRFIYKINSIIDQHIYKQILQDYLLQTIDWYHLDAERVIFQHDNDPKRRARSVQEWLDEQAFEVI